MVWGTKYHQPLIGDEDAAVVERSIRTTLRSLGAMPHAIGVMPDHVHVAVSIHPSVSISKGVGRMKGASAFALNHHPSRPREIRCARQAGFGVLSFGERALPDVIAYIRNQREHHAAKRLWAPLDVMTESATQVNSIQVV